MKKFFLLFFTSLVCAIGFSQNNFDAEALLKQRPTTQQLVNDFTNTLTADQKQALENKLVAFDDSSSTQIAVVIIPSLNGNEIADYNVKLFRAWGVGNKKTNNGAVLLIAKDDRKLNITTGYGLEGALPDITCKEIIDNDIVPNFKGNDYYRGIEEGTNQMIKAVQGEYKAPEGYNKKNSRSIGFGGIILFIIIIIIISLISGGNSGGGSFMSRRGFAPWIISSLLSGGGGGGGGWSGGGSGGGGGFGGFGGGSSGGGGASGSW